MKLLRNGLPFGLLFSSLLSSGLAHADSFSIKPGLWEHRMEMESKSGHMESAWEQVQRQMEAMPEAQKQMMMDMMEEQGMSFDFGDQTVRNCVTGEQAARGEFDWDDDGDCQRTNVDTSGGETRVEFVCEEDDAHGVMVVHSDTEYSGESRMTMDFEGQSDEILISHRGEWIADDCGNVRP